MVEDKLRDIVSVKDFGAVCNDSTDDIAAFNAALTAAASVFVPEGTCKITSTLSIATNKRLFGSGGRHGGTTIHYTGTGAAISVVTADSVTLNAIKINAPTASEGLLMNDATRFNSADLLIIGPPTIGIHLTSTSIGNFWNYFENFEVNTAVTPLKIEQGSFATNNNMFNHGILRTSTAVAGTVVVLSGTKDNTFTDVDASNYGTGASKCYDIQAGSVGITVIGGLMDTNAACTGVTVAAGVTSTRFMMGDNGCGTEVTDNSATPANVFWFHNKTLVSGLEFAGTFPAASGKLKFSDNGNVATSMYIQSGHIKLRDESNSVDRVDFDMATGRLAQSGVAFASLGTPSNGSIVYCTDCTIANPCAAVGTGAFAKRLNGAWVCN